MTDLTRFRRLMRLSPPRWLLLFMTFTVVLATRNFFFVWYEASWYSAAVQAITEGDRRAFVLRSLFYIALLLGYLVLDLIALNIQRVSLDGLKVALRQRCFDSYLRASTQAKLGFGTSSQLIARMNGDVELVGGAYGAVLLPLMFAISGIGAALILWSIHPLFLLVSLGLGALLLLAHIARGRIERHYLARTRALETEMLGQLQASYSHRRTVRGLALHLPLLRRFGQPLAVWRRATGREAAWTGLLAIGAEGALPLATLLLLVLGIGLAREGAIEVHQLVMVLSMSGSVLAMFSTLGAALANLQRALVGAQRIYELLDLDDSGEAAPLTAAEGPSAGPDAATSDTALALSGLSFAYRAGEPVLEDFSMQLARGDMMVFEAHNGYGKTTLLRLVQRFYPVATPIYVLGEEVGSLSPQALAALRRRLAYVPQGEAILSATVRYNLLLSETVDEAREQAMTALCEAFDLHARVMTLPQGYDSSIDRDTTLLSSGQKRLIAIVRALLWEPELYLLDEPFANLSAERAAAVVERLEAEQRRGAALLIVDHSGTLSGVSKRLTASTQRQGAP